MNKLIKAVKKLLSCYQVAPYHLEEIDINAAAVVIRCRGTRSIIRMSLAEAVFDPHITSGLSPQQACYLGGYYGRLLRQSLVKGKALRKAKSMSFLLNDQQGQYRIAFQNRNGDLGYIDQKTGKEFIEAPLTIVSNEHIIKQFDPSQACYIGMLAGLSLERDIQHDNITDTLNIDKPTLRIVKD